MDAPQRRARIDPGELAGFTLFALGPMLGTVVVFGELSRYVAHWLPFAVYALAFAGVACFVVIRGSEAEPTGLNRSGAAGANVGHELGFVMMEIAGLAVLFALVARELSLLAPGSFRLAMDVDRMDWLAFAALDLADCLLLGIPSVYDFESKAIAPDSFAGRTAVLVFRVLAAVFVYRTLISHWRLVRTAEFE